MATYKKRENFFESSIGLSIRQILENMDRDKSYNTGSSYSANAESYPDNRIPFVDKHMNYLSTHPATDPNHYISNLRLMTRLK